MKRLPRILLNAVSAALLLLCVATVVVWTTGAEFGAVYLNQGQLTEARPAEGMAMIVGTAGPGGFDQIEWYLGCGDGGYHVGRDRESLAPGKQMFLSDDYRPGWRQTGRVALQITRESRSLGFGFWSRSFMDGGAWLLVVPHWFVAAATAPLPAWVLVRFLRARRRAQPGLCPSCGYDLRATPERCPECGTAKPPVPYTSPRGSLPSSKGVPGWKAD